MKEFLIILAGWGLGVFPSSVQGLQRKERDASDRDREAALVVVRLTTAVEPIAKEVSLLRSRLTEDRQILDPRLNAVEQRLTAPRNQGTPMVIAPQFLHLSAAWQEKVARHGSRA